MFDSLGNSIIKPISFLLAMVGTIFLLIAVIGNSKLIVIEINPGVFGRFLALILGIVFYVLAFDPTQARFSLLMRGLKGLVCQSF